MTIRPGRAKAPYVGKSEGGLTHIHEYIPASDMVPKPTEPTTEQIISAPVDGIPVYHVQTFADPNVQQQGLYFFSPVINDRWDQIDIGLDLHYFVETDGAGARIDIGFGIYHVPRGESLDFTTADLIRPDNLEARDAWVYNSPNNNNLAYQIRSGAAADYEGCFVFYLKRYPTFDQYAGDMHLLGVSFEMNIDLSMPYE